MQSSVRIDRDVARRYHVGNRIGRGCYGLVFEVSEIESEDEHSKAMKKVLHAFRNTVDAQRTYREISYLLEFRGHDNILSVYDVMCSADDRHLYFTSELMDSDLQKALTCQVLRPIHRPLIAYQVLRALKYIHSAFVMHRDIKPSNILLDNTCRAVLCDFGWARTSPIEISGGELMTEYASTRWYRPPEMLLGARRYTTSVDMWALGCVIGEMHGEAPLIPGTSTIDMLSWITEMLGKPLMSDLIAMEAPYATFSFDTAPPGPAHHGFEVIYPTESPELHDYLRLLMQYNPEKRLNATEALQHPYIGSFHNPDSEPVFGRRLQLSLPDDEQFPAAEYRDQIYADVIGFTSSSRRVFERRRHRTHKKWVGEDEV